LKTIFLERAPAAQHQVPWRLIVNNVCSSHTDSLRMKTCQCPYCQSEMLPVFVMISGGVWLSQSRARIRRVGRVSRDGFLPPSEEELTQSRVDEHEPPLHCVIGGSGYKAGTWPKDGLYCPNCHAFVVKQKPY
jgi:hypothetical protein